MNEICSDRNSEIPVGSKGKAEIPHDEITRHSFLRRLNFIL